jgi:Peptidase family M1 domain
MKASPRLLLAAFLCLAGAAAPQEAAGPSPAPPDSPLALLERLEKTWARKDEAGYLALWEFPDTAAREEETSYVRSLPELGERHLVVERPASLSPAIRRVRTSAQLVSVNEPRGRVDQFVFTIEKRPERWVVVGRDVVGRVDGLVHLALDPSGYRADGLRVRLEDFEIEMRHGTLFLSPQLLGPTVAVFAGDAVVRFRPTPRTEAEQLRQFCGRTELVEKVRTFFLRVHPADLQKVLVPNRLEHDPGARGRFADAQRFFEQQAPRSFILDAAVPGSPWWVLPSLGDALVSFDTSKHGLLTFTVNSDQPEGVSLFDRARRLQICLYPSAGRSTRYNEDDGRPIDIVHHDLRLRFDPREERLTGEDTLRIRRLIPVSTVRLKLDEGLKVASITSAEAGRHLFFRVRNQDSLMISLGSLSTSTEDITLTVRYAGELKPTAVESEMQATLFDNPGVSNEEVRIEKVLVYSNRNAWYPQAPTDDYATASLHFETPLGYSVVTGGERVMARVEKETTLTEYRIDDPAKYFTAVVGRLVAAGTRQEGSVRLAAFGGGHTRDEAGRSLETAAAMLRFFTERFGPCPYPYLNLVIIEGIAPGGHSPPGMVILARRPLLFRKTLRDDPTNFSDVAGFFLAHEIAHQWWGQGVAGQNYRERWLSEGEAQYAAAQWAREAYGEGRFRDILRRMGDWAERKSDKGPIHLGYRLGHVKGDSEAYRALVYDKAAYVLHMLRGVVGDEAFRKGEAAFQRKFRFQKAGTDDLREALEEASGRDLRAHFDQWVFGTDLPVLGYSHRSEPAPEGGYVTTIAVRARRPLPAGVPLQIEISRGRERLATTFRLATDGGDFTMPSPWRPSRVDLNGDLGLLAQIQR